MVEKWLLQVEDTMLMSLKQVIKESVEAYPKVPRKQWVLDWPGQVVLCGSSIFWTTEVSDAMKANAIAVSDYYVINKDPAIFNYKLKF